ncbi:MAG TPA: alanine--tRNA ligase, partial [candidate division CPR3 bacterium]|nr:alanine--tRNA ligase [candidate division CPR3 bacterium]
HLMQSALREVLGNAVEQAGSDITVERTRFDFTFDRKLTDEEIKAVEDLVNKAIKNDLKVEQEEMAYQDAIGTGALHFAKEKYPAKVKVYTMGTFSKELCGGPHVSHTKEIGKFKIAKQESVAAGVRRIRGIIESA